MEAFTTFLANVWELFTSVTVPGLNITFGEMWLGIFVVGVSIMILRPLLGIGGSLGHDAANIFRGAAKRGYDRSYTKYRKDRERKESFAKRYVEDHK